MLQKIVLAGGSGYLGGLLARFYHDQCREVIVLSRKERPDEGKIKYRTWDGKTVGAWAADLEDCDLLVNLAGRSVNCRYTEKNRHEIVQSRLDSVQALEAAILGLVKAPKVWIQAASATIYRHAEDRPQDEVTGEIGTGFSVSVCKAWEEAFAKADGRGARKILLRIGLVLGPGDGVFPRLRNLARYGLGGRQGSGQQYISWIHEQDFVRVVEWCRDKGKDGSLYNVTAPEAVPNRKFMRALRKAGGQFFGLPAPVWLLQAGAVLIGTETELLLKSRWVAPKALINNGFIFRFPLVQPALVQLLDKNNSPSS